MARLYDTAVFLTALFMPVFS